MTRVRPGLCFFLSWAIRFICDVVAFGEGDHLDNLTAVHDLLLESRQTLPSGQCSTTQPCADGSCCDGSSGYCGLDPDHCAAGVCVSNCDAKAECGIGAATPGQTCPLNVCCGQWGYCGVTSDFCGSGCQSNCGQPSAIDLSDGDVQSLVIGYIESWVISPPASGCASRTLSWIPIDSLTHLNVAFGYIEPSGGFYAITPITGVDLSVFQQITNLKQQAPGLKIWLSLGGWDYSDNGTTTQAIWGDITSSESNITKFVNLLVAFMKQWGFDGVDFDWEYPGAPDRGGTTADTENYVNLLSAVRDVFDQEVSETGSSYGVSFTAPTSYWYLRWFDIGNMTVYADWVNLMTYDLHGDWDSPTDSIGSYVFAHTNLTEIESALDLLWRNNVPANKVNLGIGFYGRSYTLSDPSCTSPGCPFSSGGNPGPCTETSGYLSFDEILTIINQNGYETVWDQAAGVKYFAFDQNQWVSFDDVVTLQQKVQFANSQGLRGLMIWAVDQDNATHAALNALLWPDGLGKFSAQNGIGSNDNYGNWSLQASSCYFSACSETPMCQQAGFIADGHQILCADGTHRQLCCPINAAPDPNSCSWEWGTTPLVCLDATCPAGTVLIAESNYYWVPEVGGSGDALCFWAPAKYCCELTESPLNVCGPNAGTCIAIDTTTDLPATAQDSANACPTGRKFFTYSEGSCDTSQSLYQPWCCDEDVDTSSCHWLQSTGPILDCSHVTQCGTYETNLGTDHLGNGSDCSYFEPPFMPTSPYQQGTWQYTPRSLCCDTSALHLTTNNIPVPLDNIFPSDPPDWYDSTFQIHTDTALNPEGSLGDLDPNLNAFGWYIISGPPDEVNTLDKRDGSHWELFGCSPNMDEERHTVKAICTDDSAESNCGEIFWGGVATTVVKMPPGCGPGKYAIAVSMEPSASQVLPVRLEKRFDSPPVLYDFTFDYDYGPIVRRQDSNKLIRIDYSDDPGYWANVVLAPPGSSKRDVEEHNAKKRELQAEVDRDHGGSWERFLDHRWREERRDTPHDELHLLHKKWFSADLAQWLYKQRQIDINYDLIRHNVHDVYTWNLFDYTKICQVAGAQTTQYLKIWADLTVDVQTAAVLTLIGDFGDLNSWTESHVLFRNSGTVKATLNFDAFASMQFSTGRVELFGLQDFGATFSVPGLVTVGPNLRVFGEIDGVASFHANAQTSIQLANWDITQQYPNSNSDVESGLTEDSGVEPLAATSASDDDSGVSTPQWYGDVTVQGSLTVHLTPVAQLGIVFNILSETIPDTVVELGLDTYGTIYASAEVTGTNDVGTTEACFGALIGYELYCQVTAPTLFGYSLNQYWQLDKNNISLVDSENACVAYTLYNNTS